MNLPGMGACGHNAGVYPVEAFLAEGLRVICNEEEERYSSVKHYVGYPERSAESVCHRLKDMALSEAPRPKGRGFPERKIYQGSGYFFHDQMITSLLLNGKGPLPLR